MKMKQLHRYTTILLRTVLLLGGILLWGTNMQGQPVSLTKDMPDAFETKTPVIGDGKYYYIQFYEELTYSPYLFQSFLGEFGEGNIMHAKDYIPYAKNMQWTLVQGSASGQFKLMSKDGFYAIWGHHTDTAHPTLDKDCFMSTKTQTPTEFVLTPKTNLRDGFTYYELKVVGEDNCMSRENGDEYNREWADMIKNPSGNDHNYVRFATLKPNAAHIIYYREEHSDGRDNMQYRANEATTRHYLTYSGTDASATASQVSSRKSIIPKDKSLWTLPTAAAYHQDGLWALEETGTDGEFYIKKYGSEQYLNARMVDASNYISELGSKDALFGKYKFEDPYANRYTPIQNIRYTTNSLTSTMFYNWNGYDASASTTGAVNSTDNPDFRYRLGEQVNSGGVIVGMESVVGYKTYANLGDNTKMIINGTAGMQLRVLMNRQESDTGPYVEKNVTIGTDGRAEVDLTYLELNASKTGSATVKMTYINGSDGTLSNDGEHYLANNLNTSHGEVTTAYSGYNKLSGGRVELGNKSWGVNDLIYLQVDASAFSSLGRISKVTLKGTATGSNDGRRATLWGAGYNNSSWSANMTWNTADRSITNLTGTPEEVGKGATRQIELDITEAFTNDPDKIATILVYETAAGGGTFSNPTVEVEYYPTYNYCHLNAIKAGWSSPSGSITAISLINENNLTTDAVRYLDHHTGDGQHVPLCINKYANSLWNAAFYPVEVPTSKKDEFFQVLVGLTGSIGGKSWIELKGTNGMSVVDQDNAPEDGHVYRGTFTPTKDYQNAFRYEDFNTYSYQQIVINFGSPVPAGYWLQTYDTGWTNAVNLYGLTTYTITLRPGTHMTDFTIYNYGVEKDDDNKYKPIIISDVYFTSPNQPTEMVRWSDGWADPYSEIEGERILWQLEQENDYAHYRLKNPNNGSYLSGQGKMTQPNDPNGEVPTIVNNDSVYYKAEIYTNKKFWTDFSLKWYLPADKAPKEIVVNGYVRHKTSYLRAYADKNVITDQEGLRKQGLSRDVDSDWKEFENKVTKKPFLLDGFIQKTNYFEITHYLKKGDSKVIEFPTVLNHNNDHIFFQRFYHYDEDDTQMDLANLKAHVSLNTRDYGDVQYFLYKNGMVTGQKLDWSDYEDGGMARNEQRRFNFTNSDGKTFNVGVDVARYSDLEYLNNSDHLAGDLREPSLTMRYLFYMNDAKEMATKLTACPDGGNKWLESKEFHFGRTQVPYTRFKKVGYRGEFIPIRHIFSDYWVYDEPAFVKSDANGNAIIDTLYIKNKYGAMTNEQLSDFLDQHLVSAVNDNSSGKIEVEIDDPNHTGIRKGGYNPNLNLNDEEYDDYSINCIDDSTKYQGFYFYDKLSPNPKTEYGNSRFVVFRYPRADKNGIVQVAKCGPENAAYINVYLNNGGTRYQVAQFKLIFDANMATRPWTQIKNGTHYANGTDSVKNTVRDPNQLRLKAGNPIAKVTFDYPIGNTYHYPSIYDANSTNGVTRHHQRDHNPGGTIANSSPIPLTYGHTNYSFDGDYCNWGSYAMVTTMETHYGNQKTIVPADDDTYGYGIAADPGMQKAFLYIDASEQPGDICAMEFEGEFCANDQLMCTGWISGSNRIQGDTRCPGSITLTVKGEDAKGKSNTIYRFCPGQIYELDNGYQKPGVKELGAGVDGKTGGDHVVWQQFYFEFSTDQKYERYWLEVNNNCVSSNGGDFMLDNVEVYTIVPEVIPDINTPLCVQRDGTADMKLLKLKVDYNKLLSSVIKKENPSSGTATETPTTSYLGLVFLDKDKFLTTLREELGETNVSLSVMAERVETGYYDNELDGGDTRFQNAFNAALLRNGNSTAIWKSDAPSTHKGAGVLYFKWNKTFTTDADQPVYTFANAVGKTSPVYRATEDGVDYLILNGNFAELPWMPNTEYYIVPSNTYIESFNLVYDAFNICSNCSKASTFEVEPPYKILSMEAPDITDDYAFCEGKTPTLLVDLKGYTSAGEPTLLKNLNYDWWLGSDNTTATLENYHKETNDAGTVKLDDALYAFRNYYPSVTSVDGVKEQLSQQPYLTREMIYYLQELVNKGELVLHQKSISILAKKTSADYPYFYMVACPILDYDFYHAVDSVPSAYFCEAPQGLRMKVGEKAPSLKTGFVPDENGLFDAYHYPESNIVLSVRLAKKAQFETVKHGEKTEAPVEPSADNGPDADEGNQLRYLWLPLRDAKVQSGESTKVIQKSDDYNIYLASTDDPTWDKEIYLSMNTAARTLPVVGKIVQLNAIDKNKEANNLYTERDSNRLCVYFTENFEVREGYNYTLSLPFKESPGTNTCDGTILMHLKIVPDYEVWTGGAGNTDWNNDQNWRRADGNMTVPSEESTDESALNNNELLVSDDLPDTSGLYDYTTNYQNYRTAKDRLLRKGYAPLYCTHILLKGNEWGDAPVLFDALNGKSALDASPFPNLSETYEVNTVEYSIDEKYTTIDAIGNNSFAIVNETDNTGSKMLYGTNAQNLGYGSYEAAMQYTNSGFYFKLVPAVNVTDENNNVIEGNLYYLWLQTPGGQNYTVFSEPGYLNSQPATGWCSFILGLNGRNGQDIKNGAVWKIEESDGKFALKNMGTGLYLKNAGPANNEEPTHFTFCKLQGETVSSSSNVRANVLKYDIQAREYSIWKDTYGEDPDKGRAGDLIAEMYQINSCDEIAFQPSAELLNAHLLNYNNAWMEYQLDMNRWYLLGSALQGTIAGEWYAPTGTAQQETTYYENVTFGEGYDRYSPAIYQRSWDKAKAVLYEIGSTYNTNDDSQTENLGSPLQGAWSGTTWSTTGADRYLDRLGYKPMDGNKANVAIQGVWSNTYNDATVDYTKGGFSVMVNNGLKNNDSSDGTSIIRLPKEDTMYDYYKYSETGAADGGTDTYLINRTEDEEEIPGVQTAKNRAKNRGRLKTDLLLPVLKNTQEEKIIQKTEKTVSRYGDQRTYTRIPIKEDSLIAMNAETFSFSETIPAGQSHLGFYLVENPFPCGLNMNKFFDDEANPILVDHKKYWLLKVNDNGKQEQQLVQLAPDGTWIQQSSGAFEPADSIIAPGQGFFVQAPTTNETTAITFNFNKDMQAQSRYGVKRGASKSYTIVVGTKIVNNQPEEITNTVEINSYTQNGNKKYPLKAPTRAAKAEGGSPLGLVITALRDGYYSSALVMQREQASNDFLPAEDTETFLNSDLKQVPTVYTLCGRLATTINSIHDFSYLPLGVESASDAPCTLTFKNVEALGDSVAFYDAVEKKLTPLESGMQFSVSGQTQNRYYLVRSLSKEEAAAETHLQIFTEGLTAKVIASTAEPITSVRCYDTAGRLIHQATPQTSEYSFSLPRAGIYIIEAKTENDRKTKKVLTK